MSKLVKVYGRVVIDKHDDGSFEVVDYDTDVIVDDSVQTIPQARSLIRKTVIKPHLKALKDDKGQELYPNLKHVKEMQVESIIDSKKEVKGDKELQKLLIEALELNCTPSELESRSSDNAKKDVLKSAIAKTKQRNAVAKRKAELQAEAKLMN